MEIAFLKRRKNSNIDKKKKKERKRPQFDASLVVLGRREALASFRVLLGVLSRSLCVESPDYW